MARPWRVNKKIVLVGIALVIILLYNLTPARYALSWLAGPLEKGGGVFFKAGRGVAYAWEGLTQGFALQKQLAEKEKIIAELAAANTALHYLQAENRDWRALANLPERVSGHRVINADVVWLASDAEKSLLTINRGSNAGVKEKFPVLSGNGVFIGKVLAVRPESATVLLTLDRASAVAATSARDANLQAIVKGKMGLSLSLELIPQSAELEAGDIIVTSSLEENTPLGLALGRVASVYYKEGELFKRANLEPLESIQSLRVVGVLAPEN